MSNLPTSRATPKLKIKNVIKQQQCIQQQLKQLNFSNSSVKLESIHTDLKTTVAEIEKICAGHQVTPKALPIPSRKAYAWMKFLTVSSNWQLHLTAMREIQTLARQLLKKQQTDISGIWVSFNNCNYLCKYKKNAQAQIDLQLSEGYIQAETQILSSLVKMSVWGGNLQDKQLVRKFSESEEYKEIILELEMLAELDEEKPNGTYFDLKKIFTKLNREYFAGQMTAPRLSWSQMLTYRKFGHYEPLRDKVVLSCALDSPEVPYILVEFVLYHELLHKHLGAKWVNGKRIAHTTEFRRWEKRYQDYQKASQMLYR